MAVVSFNRKIFEKEISKLSEEMQHKISMFGTPVEHINENELQVEVFPNRPDLLSYHGFKRAFLAFIEKETGIVEYKVNPPKKDYKVIVEPSVKNVRPYTACAIIEGLSLDNEKIKEIIEVQEKLHVTIGRKRKKIAIGIYPLEKIKLPITYKAMNPENIKFIPLDSEKEMSSLEILKNTFAGREYASLLSGKEKFPVFVDSNNDILSMPPIINSQTVGKIDKNTKDVFIECSGFDLNVLKKCINILTTCLADMGGKIYQMEVINGNEKNIFPDLNPEEMNLSIDNVNKLLGLNINEKDVKKMLERMGLGYKKPNTVVIPSWRTDIIHEVDLIEDIAIAFGYDNFMPEIPRISTIGGELQEEKIRRKFSEILIGLGMNEVLNYHLTTKQDQFKKTGIKENGFVDLEESKTEYSILRKDLSHFLMKILSENIDVEYPQKIFEMGKVFDVDSKGKIAEKECLAAAVSSGNFTDIRQIIEYFANFIDKKIEFKESEKDSPEYLIEGRRAELIFNGKRIGFAGEVHPRILKNWKIKMPVAIFEISLKDIFESLKQGN